MIQQNVLAWRSEYYRGEGNAVQYVEWFVATNYGLGHFQIRRQGQQRPTFKVETQIKNFGWLQKDGHNAVERHMLLNKMRRRCTELGARVLPLHQESIEAMNEVWMLDQLFQNDTKAHNAWCNLTGVPVGQTFEQIASMAETLTAQKREDDRIARVAVLAEADPAWGMF